MSSEFPVARDRTQPRWPSLIALAAVAGLHAALPASLMIGPPWLLFVIVTVLLIPTVISHQRGHENINLVLGLSVPAIVTVFMIWSVILLVGSILTHTTEVDLLTPIKLLKAAGALWLTNILVFALWYWRLDAGGPSRRDLKSSHTDGAFLFPQMTLDDTTRAETGETDWMPGFVDYLFLAFNTSTALSPTDTAALSRWAKGLMMVQSIISLTVIGLLAARGVNIL